MERRSSSLLFSITILSSPFHQMMDGLLFFVSLLSILLLSLSSLPSLSDTSELVFLPTHSMYLDTPSSLSLI